MKSKMQAILIGFIVTCVLPALAASQPLKVFILAGQSNMEGQGRISEGSRATLKMLLKKDDAGTYQHLTDKDGNWTIRDDAWIYYNRQNNPVRGGLTVGQGANSAKFGPELQIGHILGDLLENQVLLIKSCWGGKSLAGDFRPPSSGGQTGKCYKDMLSTVEDVLSHLDTYFPNYKGQGYEIAGFFWWQGWNDACLGPEAVDEYTDNLANLIRNVRAEWKVPDLPIVIATSGNGGNPPTIKDGVFMRIHNDLVPAQRAVTKIPEFKTTVAIAETWDFWRGPKESPADAGHHWNDNAESYFQVGTAMGLRMTELLSGVSSKAPAQVKQTPYEPTSHYTVKDIEGWKVYVNNALLPGGEHAETGTAALKQLQHDMVRVKQWVPDEPLEILLKVGVWLEVDTTNGPHGKTPVFHYHPGLDWLVKMDFHPGKHKCVEFSRASSLVQAGQRKRSAKTLLHEFAHAYHDQILTFDDPDILAAHKRAREGTAYPSNDWVVRANHKEFFAGVSTRYFGTKEEREALVERDPILLKKLQQVWGTPKAFMDTLPPKPDGSKKTPTTEPNEQDIQLAKEKMQRLREVYKEVQQAEVELQRLTEEAEREEPLLRPTVEALKDMRDFYENEIKDGQRFQKYLNNSKDRKAAYRLYSDCKGAFVNNKTIQFLSDPNQERLVIKPLLYIYRRLSKETLQESLPGFDPNDPNDERVWQKLKQMHFKRTPDEYLQRARKYYIEVKGVPEWLPDYAGDMAFADQMINTYETGILLLTPQDVCDAEKRVDNLYTKIGKIYPRWNQMRHLLAGENNPDNKAVIRAVQEHMQIWPTVYRKLTQTKKGRR